MLKSLPRPLASKLVLKRAANFKDLEAILACHVANFGADDLAGLRAHIFSRPGQVPENFIFVEDTETGEAVSSVSFLPQTWTYEGIPLNVSEVGLVSTRPSYRHKGLVREQFQEYHRLALERGCLLSAIAGIGYFYRQFGYEYCLPMGGGHRLRPEQIPELKEGETSPYRLRRAQAQDMPLLQRYYAELVKGLCVSSIIPDEIWRYQDTQPEDSVDRKVTYIVEREGIPLGYVRLMGRETTHDDFGKGVRIVEAFVPQYKACLEVLRFAKRLALAERQERIVKVEMALDIPLNQAAEMLGGEWQRPYGWQIRVIDSLRFLAAIGPALERRLEASPLAGLSRDLTISLHTEALALHFVQGHLGSVERLAEGTRCDLTLPPNAAPMLWLGHRSLNELMQWYPDTWCRNAEAKYLTDILFPKRPSWICSVF